MTPAALILARDADSTATQAATDLWTAIVDPPPSGAGIDANAAGAALDLVSAHVGSATDVPDAVLREAVIRCGAWLANTAGSVGLHGVTVGGAVTVDPNPMRAGGSALLRSGALALLAPWKRRRARVI